MNMMWFAWLEVFSGWSKEWHTCSHEHASILLHGSHHGSGCGYPTNSSNSDVWGPLLLSQNGNNGTCFHHVFPRSWGEPNYPYYPNCKKPIPLRRTHILLANLAALRRTHHRHIHSGAGEFGSKPRHRLMLRNGSRWVFNYLQILQIVMIF